MNQYATMALRHWKKWLPNRYAALEDPTTFFTQLGERAAATIADETTQAATRLPQQPDYLAAVGEWNALRNGIEERVLREMILIDPEPQMLEDDLEDDPLETPSGMPTDPDHPLWKMREDDSISVDEFRTALLRWRATLPPALH